MSATLHSMHQAQRGGDLKSGMHSNLTSLFDGIQVKKPLVSDDELVMHQVRYLGLTENVKVRRAGFCFRLPFAPFLQRYNALCAETWPMKPFNQVTGQDIEMLLSSGTARNWGIRELQVEPLRLEKGVDYVIGRTKVRKRCPSPSSAPLMVTSGVHPRTPNTYPPGNAACEGTAMRCPSPADSH